MSGPILVDAELFYNRAPGEVVVVDGVTYTVGYNLVGTIEAAFVNFLPVAPRREPFSSMANMTVLISVL